MLCPFFREEDDLLKRRYFYFKCLMMLIIPVLAGCQSAEWNVAEPNSDTAGSLVSEFHGYLKPFVIGLAIAGIGFNAITIIVTPTGRYTSDEAIAIARKRIIIIISAVIAFMTIERLFRGGF